MQQICILLVRTVCYG